MDGIFDRKINKDELYDRMKRCPKLHVLVLWNFYLNEPHENIQYKGNKSPFPYHPNSYRYRWSTPVVPSFTRFKLERAPSCAISGDKIRSSESLTDPQVGKCTIGSRTLRCESWRGYLIGIGLFGLTLATVVPKWRTTMANRGNRDVWSVSMVEIFVFLLGNRRCRWRRRWNSVVMDFPADFTGRRFKFTCFK